MKRLVTTLVVLAALVAGGASGCFVPSVPVPPPSPSDMTFALDTAQGQATYAANLGGDWANSWVTVYDDTTGMGVLDRSDGQGHVGPTAPWRANDGDHVRIVFQRDDGEESGVCLILRGGASSPANVCTN